jgi:hypothetical protein
MFGAIADKLELQSTDLERADMERRAPKDRVASHFRRMEEGRP